MCEWPEGASNLYARIRVLPDGFSTGVPSGSVPSSGSISAGFGVCSGRGSLIVGSAARGSVFAIIGL